MALAKVQKIQLVAISHHKEKFLEIIQNSGTLDIIEIEEEQNQYSSLNELQKTDLKFANLEYAITLLSPYGKKKSMFAPPIMMTTKEVKEKTQEFDHEKIINSCLETEDILIKAKNRLATIKGELILYKPWKNLGIKLEDLAPTEKTALAVGSVKTNLFGQATEKIHALSNLISSEVVKNDGIDTYFVVVFEKELEKEIRQVLAEYKFTEADFPKSEGRLSSYMEDLEEEADKQKDIIKSQESELRSLAKNLENLKITRDYFAWQKEKLETDKKFGATEYSFIITAWVPEKDLPKLEENLQKITNEFEISETPLKEGEEPPVIIRNSGFITPFEAVSSIYGLPKHDELDPTPFLAIFFIIYFALCLTDAGYGLVMFIIMALALRFFKLPAGIKKLVKLLMYGGIVTFFIGAVFGGWFGLTPDQVPEFLTYINPAGDRMFLLQKINALNSPITVLVLALTLGFIQLLLGVIMKFVHSFKTGSKKDALMDSGTWVLMLSGIGFFILVTTNLLPSALGIVAKIWVGIAALALIATQGRDKGNIVLKLLSGILSLYGLVGYMSDILSYSRILALGLATAIIGLAVNIVADLVGGLPIIGWVLMVIVFIGGHIFNLLINALGAFIHSGRLQFVEFFTKFMEGGGAEFKPFSKKSKYIYIKNNQ
ncbi:MAG: V-type ATP synthase subunit I [Candidatus Peregrinibacteria bacterium]